jgi:hypothetical protein
MDATFRKYLNNKRIEKRITLRRFAELVGVVPGHISDGGGDVRYGGYCRRE